jgi:hypothetical protein
MRAFMEWLDGSPAAAVITLCLGFAFFKVWEWWTRRRVLEKAIRAFGGRP